MQGRRAIVTEWTRPIDGGWSISGRIARLATLGPMSLLLNPATNDYSQFDAETRRLLRATIDFFESYGKERLLQADLNAEWVTDFLEFEKKEKLFATFLSLIHI